MPARSNRFQRLITLLQGLLGTEGTVRESAMVPEINSGELREVDILIEFKAHSYSVVIAIEVVGRSKKSDVIWVEGMRSKHLALGTHKLILVSEKGFTKSALKKAGEFGYEAISIDSALNMDWRLLSRLEAMRIFEITEFKYKCQAIQATDGQLTFVELAPSQGICCGGSEGNIDQLVHMLLAQSAGKDAMYEEIKKGQKDFWISYQDPSLEIIGHDVLNKVFELRISIEAKQSSSTLDFSAGMYKQLPFIEGYGGAHGNTSHLVMTKRDDGSYDALLLDAEGLRKLRLTPDPDLQM